PTPPFERDGASSTASSLRRQGRGGIGQARGGVFACKHQAQRPVAIRGVRGRRWRYEAHRAAADKPHTTPTGGCDGEDWHGRIASGDARRQQGRRPERPRDRVLETIEG